MPNSSGQIPACCRQVCMCCTEVARLYPKYMRCPLAMSSLGCAVKLVLRRPPNRCTPCKSIHLPVNHTLEARHAHEAPGCDAGAHVWPGGPSSVCAVCDGVAIDAHQGGQERRVQFIWEASLPQCQQSTRMHGKADVAHILHLQTGCVPISTTTVHHFNHELPTSSPWGVPASSESQDRVHV